MPFDFDELTGEEIDKDELEWRRTLREAVASGTLRGRPMKGGWEFDAPEEEPEPPEAPQILQNPSNSGVNEVEPPQPPVEQLPAVQAENALADASVGLDAGTDAGLTGKDRQSFDQDYETLTNGVTMGFGPEASPRIAKALYEATRNLSDEKFDTAQFDQMAARISQTNVPDDMKASLIQQLQVQANRPSDKEIALSAFKEMFDGQIVGYTPEGLEAAWDHMLTIAKDNFGNANPNVLQIADVAASIGPGGIMGLARGAKLGLPVAARMAGTEMALDTTALALSEGAQKTLPENTPDWVRTLVVTSTGVAPYTVNSSGVLGGVMTSLAAAAPVTLAHEAGIPTGPTIPGAGSLGDLTLMLSGAAGATLMRGRWHAVEQAIKDGKSLSETGITDTMAKALNDEQRLIREAQPDDMVALYHGTSSENARLIRENGFDPAGALTADPEVAMLHAVNRGMADPTVVPFYVKRSQIEENGWYFSAKERLNPVESQPWIENAKSMVKDFLHQGGLGDLSSERGSFLTPGRDTDPLPNDVSATAFGDDGLDFTFERENIQMELQAQERARMWTDAETRTAPTVDINNLYQDARKRAAFWQELVDNPEMSIEMVRREAEAAGITGDELEDVGARPTRPGEDASPLQTELYDQLLTDDRTALYSAIADVQKYGEELYRRTDGREGVPERIKSAIRQFLAEEEGAIRLPAMDMGRDQYVVYPFSTKGMGYHGSAVNTIRLLGDITVDPHYRLVDKVGDFLKDTVLNSHDMTRSDPLGTQVVIQDKRARERLDAIGKANVAQFSYYAREYFKADNHGLIIEFQKGGIDITLQDLAAKWDTYQKILSPDQNRALQNMKDAMEKYNAALREQGIELGHRHDITPGGFYLPRGDVFEDSRGLGSADPKLYEREGIRVPRGRSPKKGFERTAIFDSMVEGMKNGVGYLPFEQVMDVHFRRAGDRILNSHWENVFLNVEDPMGNSISMDEARRLAKMFPKLKGKVEILRKQVESLDKSLDTLDSRIHKELKKFLYNPAPDLTPLKDALDAVYTKNGTIRIRETLAPADKRRNAMELFKQVNAELRVSRGKYKGLSGQEARRQMFKDKIEAHAIGRGRFKGVTFEQGQLLLNNLKSALAAEMPAWEAAKKQARATSATLESGEHGIPIKQTVSFGQNLSGVSFQESFASVVNEYFDSIGKARGKGSGAPNFVYGLNSVLRMLRATADVSFIGIQGLLGMMHEPKSYGAAMGHAFKAMATPNGHHALGKYIDDFNTTAAKKGLPTVQEWAAKGLHVGGLETEFTQQQGLGRLPVLKQANRGFGYFGDILRLDGAQKLLERQAGKLGQGSNQGATLARRQQVSREQQMREIATAQNLMTGWTPNRFGGDIGELAFFAPRFFQSQFELLGKAMTDRSLTGVEARAQLRNLIGVGVLMTAGANAIAGNDDFDWMSLKDDQGRLNPNFMRIRVGGPLGDVSLFGPWDGLLKGLYATFDGDFQYMARTKASPTMALLYDQIAGENLVGEKVPQAYKNMSDVLGVVGSTVKGTEYDIQGDWRPTVWGEFALRQLLPFSFADQVADAAVGEKSPLEALTGVAAGATGLKSAPMSKGELVQRSRGDVINELIEDGTIPEEFAQVYKNVDFYALPSAMQKFINKETETRYPELYKEWQQKRVDQGNVFAERQVAADAERQRYKGDMNKLFEQLLKGENPYYVWQAYDTTRNKMAGSLQTVYEGRDAAAYRKEIDALPMNDARRLEDAYNQLVEKAGGGKPIESYTNEDWEVVEELQAQFKSSLEAINPERAKLFNYNLELREKLNLEAAHPMERLRKESQKVLEPYYQLRDAVEKGQAEESALGSWLRGNPEADYLRWLTTKPGSPDSTPTLNSVEAAEMAVNSFGNTKRPVRLANSNLEITVDNLTILQQYANEIKQLNETPATATRGNRTTNPRTELRRRDALYDSLYFYLGYIKPDEKGFVPVYHLEAVRRNLELWGGRSDGAKPRRAS